MKEKGWGNRGPKRHLRHAVVPILSVERTGQRTLGTGAIVADDIDDESVFELPQVLNLLDDPADLVVGIGA